MAKKQKTTRRKKTTASPRQSDGVFLLKIMLFVLLGSMWLKFGTPLTLGEFVLNGIPIGLVAGLIFAHHDHFQVDRKIEYVLLIGVTILTYFYPAGIVI